MSLVGSELNIELDFNDLEGEEVIDGNDQANPVSPNKSAMSDESDGHDPPTPQTGMENFFLAGLPTQNISAAALAQELNQRRDTSHNGQSSSYDEYKSAKSQSDYFKTYHSDHCRSTEDEEVEELIFSEDAILYSREVRAETKQAPEITKQRTMAATKTTSPTIASVPPPVSTEEFDEPMHVDPAEKVYDTIKGAWGWGKGVVIFSPFLGLAEGIAGKVVQTVGSSLEDMDSNLTGKLHGLDDGILNPAIKVVVKTVMGAASMTEQFMKPIIVVFLKPIDYMIKSKPENETSAPEVTPDIDMN